MNTKIFVLFGSLSGFLAVALGAFGAHGLKEKLSADLLGVFETGVRYQMYHALAMFAVCWVLTTYGGRATVWSGWLFVVGTVIFSGSLYLLALTGVRTWGAVTPIGGLAFLAGWFCLALGIFKHA